MRTIGVAAFGAGLTMLVAASGAPADDVEYVPVPHYFSGLLSGPSGTDFAFSFDVGPSARNLSFQIAGPEEGDADLYVKFGAPPTVGVIVNDDENCVPFIGGSGEYCTFAAPAEGTWYVIVHAFTQIDQVGLGVDWEVPADTAPAPFCFDDEVAAPASRVRSNRITVRGINTTAPISIAGHPSARFRINGGDWQRGPSTVSESDHVQLRLLAPPVPGTRSARLDIGGAKSRWTVTVEP